MLNNFYDKYIFTGTLKFTHDNFFLIDIPFFMMPSEILMDIAGSNDVELHKKIYVAIKASTKEKLIPKFGEYGTELIRELELFRAYFSGSGWGSVKIIDFDPKTRRAIVLLENSPFASALKIKSKLPVDIFFRGVLAGAFSAFFKDDIDCVETECSALGGARCKFVLKPQGEFDFGNEMVQDQLHVE